MGLSGAYCWAAGHNYIGTEHILMGLLREGEGVAARVLETLGADQAKIRTQVRGRLGVPWMQFCCAAGLHMAAQQQRQQLCPA